MVKTIITCFLFLASVVYGIGQNIIRDVERLIDAIEEIENPKDTINGVDTAAAAQVLAILQYYTAPFKLDKDRVCSPVELKSRFVSRDFIEYLPLDSSLFFQSGVVELASRYLKEMRNGDRNNIMNTLYSRQVISPADYLSFSKSVSGYQSPIAAPLQTMRQAAENSNKNIKSGAVISQIAIIEGLGQFVLERAKDEVVVTFIEHLLNKETPNFTALFPAVVEEFNNLNFKFSTPFIARLRQAFYEDIQLLSIRLPDLFYEEDYFKPLQSDVIGYNALAIFWLASLVQQGMPIEEALPAIHRYLYEAYQNSTKGLSLVIANAAHDDTTEYQKLVQMSAGILETILNIYKHLSDYEETIVAQANQYEEKDSTTSCLPDLNEYWSELYNLKTVLGGSNDFDLSFLPQFLAGELDTAYLMRHNTLESYDKYFGADWQPAHWRAAGVELVRAISGNWKENLSIIDILQGWEAALWRYSIDVENCMNQLDPDRLKPNQEKLTKEIASLKDAISASHQFWRERVPLSKNQDLAFQALGNLIGNNVLENIGLHQELDEISNKGAGSSTMSHGRERLTEVEKRLGILDSTLYADNPAIHLASPARKYFIQKELTNQELSAKAMIRTLNGKIEEMQRQLFVVDSMYGNDIHRARQNARPILQITELTARLMFALHSGESNSKWLTRQQLDTLLDGEKKEVIFLGLLQQLLGNTREIGPLSRTGLADLARLTISDLALLPTPNSQDSLRAEDSLVFYRTASFVVNAFNRLIELPLMPEVNNPRQYTSLKTHIPGLAPVPAISERMLDLIYHLNEKNHVKALSSLIRLFTHLNQEAKEKEEDKKSNKRNQVIRYLQEYGDFIAGLIDAESEDQVKELLQQIADPPGSSRIKRKSPLTVGLNAYLGAAGGYETWARTETTEREAFAAVAPTMPVGVSISGLLGGKRQSFSAFISLLDLGGLLTYQVGSSSQLETEINFKNVFKPGGQLHWNIPKSPFYLGVGWQRGPHFVTNSNNETIFVASSRFFTAFGVDVPIKTVYQRR